MGTQNIHTEIIEDESRPERPSTRAIFGNPQFKILLQIWGPKPKRQRRAMILAMIEALSPWIRIIRSGHIVHRDSHWKTILTALDRKISLRDALKCDTEAQKIGTEIRMLRLKSGLSQKSLAEACHLSRSHLSDLERGKCLAREATLATIFEVLYSGTKSPEFKPDNPTLG